jgi:hypothetical protein
VTYREETDLTTEAHAPLLGKLLNAAKAIQKIDKRGTHTQGYSYVQAVDVVRTVREELFKRGVIVVPGATGAEHHEYKSSNGKAAFLTTLTLNYRFIEQTTGASIEIPWVGVGADTGGDKGVYKAYTGGLKYALLSLFLIPTTDLNDPERDNFSDATPPDDVPAPRVPNPRIPVDRAKAILDKAIKVGLATLNLDAEPGTPPEFHAVLKAQLALLGVDKIGELDSDNAEAMEAFLRAEETPDGTHT